MAISSAQPEQKNVVVNPAIHTVFFESQALAYNYKTGQWSRLPASDGKRFFSVQEADRVLGTIEENGKAIVMIQDSNQAAATPSTATIVAGEVQPNPVGRAVIDSARPVHDGASLTSIRVGTRDLPSDSVSWATGTALNSRTGQSNFRNGTNTPEGRYLRAEFVFGGGFTTVSGADFGWFDAGKV